MGLSRDPKLHGASSVWTIVHLRGLSAVPMVITCVPHRWVTGRLPLTLKAKRRRRKKPADLKFSEKHTGFSFLASKGLCGFRVRTTVSSTKQLSCSRNCSAIEFLRNDGRYVHSGSLPCLTTGWLWTWSKTRCAVGLWFQSQLVLAALGENFCWTGFLGLDLIHTQLFESYTKKKKKEKPSLDLRDSHHHNPQGSDNPASGQPPFSEAHHVPG